MKNITISTLIFGLVLSGCSQNNPEPSIQIDSLTLSIHYDQNHQFILTKGNSKIAATDFRWTSSDTLVGNVDTNGKFIARKIGETTIQGISGKNTLESKITVIPYVTAIQEPLHLYGETRETIKTNEKRVLTGDLTLSMIYAASTGSLTNNLIYIFENNKLVRTGMYFGPTDADENTLHKFIRERYPTFIIREGQTITINDELTYQITQSTNPAGGGNLYYSPISTVAN